MIQSIQTGVAEGRPMQNPEVESRGREEAGMPDGGGFADGRACVEICYLRGTSVTEDSECEIYNNMRGIKAWWRLGVEVEAEAEQHQDGVRDRIGEAIAGGLFGSNVNLVNTTSRKRVWQKGKEQTHQRARTGAQERAGPVCWSLNP